MSETMSEMWSSLLERQSYVSFLISFPLAIHLHTHTCTDGPRGCKECGTHSIKRGGNGKGFCLQILERGNTTCPCDFHKKASEREIARVKRHARRT